MDGIRHGRRTPLRDLDFLAGRFVFELGDDPGPAQIGFFQGSDRTPPPGHSRGTYHHIFRKRIIDPEFMGPLDRYFVAYNSGNEFSGDVVTCADEHNARPMMLNSPFAAMD